MRASELILVGTFALGVWLVVQAIPTRTPPSLAERVAPYLVSGQAPFSIAQSVPPRIALPPGLVSLAQFLGVHLTRMTGGEKTIQRRLDLLGRGQSHEEFRLEQVVWGLAGATAALAIVAVRGIAAGELLASAFLIALGGVGGVLARDQALTRSVHLRTERLRTELPTVVEMLAMAVGAGASLTSALERVRAVGHGVMADELGRVLDDTRVGLPLAPALQQMAARNDINEVSRFVDAVVVATERGTPLSDVLAAQAGDARESGRRALIEAGGRKEIGMMVPVVFMVLPLSVLFVLFPGFYGLSLGS